MGGDRGRRYAIASALAATAALYGWGRERRVDHDHPSADSASVAVDPHPRDGAQDDELAPRSTPAREPRVARPGPQDDPPEPEHGIAIVFASAGSGAFEESPEPEQEGEELPVAEECIVVEEVSAGEGACGEGACGEGSCGEGSCG